jgi:hypothetical protein
MRQRLSDFPSSHHNTAELEISFNSSVPKMSLEKSRLPSLCAVKSDTPRSFRSSKESNSPVNSTPQILPPLVKGQSFLPQLGIERISRIKQKSLSFTPSRVLPLLESRKKATSMKLLKKISYGDNFDGTYG